VVTVLALHQYMSFFYLLLAIEALVRTLHILHRVLKEPGGKVCLCLVTVCV